jgi:hypothetical protein
MRDTRALAICIGFALVLFLMACSGGGSKSFAGAAEVPTNISGTSNTSGIGAGAALSAPGSSQATTTPTRTPAPSK